jgi:hypothetical protein
MLDPIGDHLGVVLNLRAAAALDSQPWAAEIREQESGGQGEQWALDACLDATFPEI